MLEPSSILFEDNHLIVVDKPFRIPTQPDSSCDLSLFEWTKDYIKKKYQKKGNVFLGLVHRLDRPVAGVVIFAKTSKAASRLSEQIRNREVNKIYYAFVPSKKTLPKKKVLKSSFHNKESVLIFEALSQEHERALLKIQLLTGRKHQIRFQLSKEGFPIYGDKRYGSTHSYKPFCIALICKEMRILHPTTKKELVFVSRQNL